MYDKKVFEGVPKENIKIILKFIKESYDEKEIISPTIRNIFKSYEMIDINNVRVAIFGKDPFPNPKLATGNAFSTPVDVFSETTEHMLEKFLLHTPDDYVSKLTNGLYEDASYSNINSTNIDYLNDQGVLLTNLALTLRAKRKINTKKELDMWFENFTKYKMQYLLNSKNSVAILAFGAQANFYLEKCLPDKVSCNKFILQASHPARNGRSVDINDGTICSFNNTDFSLLQQFYFESFGTYLDFRNSIDIEYSRKRNNII